MRALLTVSALALFWAGCTNDFGAFSFGPQDGAVADAANGSPEGGAEDAAAAEDAGPEASVPSTDSGMDSGQTDSGGEPDAAPGQDAAEPEQDASMDSGPAEDAAVETDAGVDSGQQQDAGGFDAAACRAALEPLVLDGRVICDDCGCWGCGFEVMGCLQSGDGAEDALCSDVLECALQNSCQVWDCYCNEPNCGGGDPDGTGPCVAEMNAAAGGQKAEVFSVWQSDDGTEPLVRALDAVRCLIGSHQRSPGGASSGVCEADCL
jgi:hypothetical protein